MHVHEEVASTLTHVADHRNECGSGPLLVMAHTAPVRRQAGFRVETPSGTVFEDVDLSEDWAEYDEKAGVSVGIYELESKFAAVKS